MTLQEKFENAPIVYDDSLNFIKNYEAIADEFAIGFAEWMAKEYWLSSSGKYLQGHTHQELLKIYKKEKGL